MRMIKNKFPPKHWRMKISRKEGIRRFSEDLRGIKKKGGIQEEILEEPRLPLTLLISNVGYAVIFWLHPGFIQAPAKYMDFVTYTISE